MHENLEIEMHLPHTDDDDDNAVVPFHVLLVAAIGIKLRDSDWAASLVEEMLDRHPGTANEDAVHPVQETDPATT